MHSGAIPVQVTSEVPCTWLQISSCFLAAGCGDWDLLQGGSVQKNQMVPR